MFKFIFKGLLDFVKFTDIFHFIHLPLSEANFGLVFKFVFKDLLALFKFTERVFIHFPIFGINFGLMFIFKGLLESSGSMTYSFAHQFQKSKSTYTLWSGSWIGIGCKCFLTRITLVCFQFHFVFP